MLCKLQYVIRNKTLVFFAFPGVFFYAFLIVLRLFIELSSIPLVKDMIIQTLVRMYMFLTQQKKECVEAKRSLRFPSIELSRRLGKPTEICHR